ncbi:MAG TPA: pentapeptide repeat-containing protein, partial [Rhodobacteraceae bacterium]|nr:pentapeptide repeat-containing protein [Paracoccaceae bacterium]
MKQTLTALTVAATMFASSASAFDPDDLQKLKDTGDCVQCDLKDANLVRA